MSQLYNRDNTKINEDVLILQSQDERQINSIHYDTQAIEIALSFDVSQFKNPVMIKLDNFIEVGKPQSITNSTYYILNTVICRFKGNT